MTRVRAYAPRVLAVIFAATVALCWVAVTAARPAVAQGTTTAVVVIDTGNGVSSFTVNVGGGMSGVDALRAAVGNDQVVVKPFGGVGVAICGIVGVPADAPNGCLTGGQYWAYWRATDGATGWKYSGVGAGATVVHGGDVEGWHFGTGDAPRADAAFCNYIGSCAPPPAAPASGGGAPSGGTSSGGTPAGNASATGGTGPAASGTDIPRAIVGSNGGGIFDAGDSTSASGDPSGPTASTSTTGAASTHTRRISGDDRATALGASKGGDSGSGSPVGVVVVAAVLVVGTTVTVLLRRRGRGSANAAP